ncbi:MAG: hypothetical protein HRU41_06475 [Saprospiraceae bacterium]|nr:hypothetical protein [Saprospiraceae bacterium]
MQQTQRALQIAFVDDRIKNLEGWLQAMQAFCSPETLLSTFLSVDELEEALEAEYIPNIVFTDYFIEDRNGLEVIEILRSRFGDQVYLIAHSAEPWANELMYKEGADETLTKFEDQVPSSPIDERFRGYDDLLDLLNWKGI